MDERWDEVSEAGRLEVRGEYLLFTSLTSSHLEEDDNWGKASLITTAAEKMFWWANASLEMMVTKTSTQRVLNGYQMSQCS